MWFKLCALPLEFSNPRILEALGNSLGKYLLLDMTIIDGFFCINICVLINLNQIFPRFFNLKSIDGIWRQDIVRDSESFHKTLVTLDVPLFKKLKLNPNKETPKFKTKFLSDPLTLKGASNLNILGTLELESGEEPSENPNIVEGARDGNVLLTKILPEFPPWFSGGKEYVGYQPRGDNS